MWVEAILSRDDLTRLLGEALPLTVRVGDASDHHSLSLFDPEVVTLVADRGLRVVCKARVHWPVLGIEVPIVLNSLAVDLRPEIGRTDGHDALFFRVEIAHTDMAGVPAVIDRAIADAINARLEEKRDALTWDFSTTLRDVFPLPDLLDPLHGFALEVAWGKVRVTEEAVVLALSFHSRVLRHGDPIAPAPLPPPRSSTADGAPPRARPLARPRLALPLARREDTLRLAMVAASFGLAAGAGYFAFRSVVRGR
jgi:hypothetical protein